MSYTTVLSLYPNDRYETIKELKNSWGSAPVIWDFFCKKYFNAEMWTPPLIEKMPPMWEDLSIPEYERSVLCMTFDRTYILKKYFKRAANDIAKFFKENPSDPERVNHWPAIQKIFEDDLDVPAIGFWHTSVGDCLFDGEWDEEKEETKMIAWDECYDIYEYLDNLKEK